MEDWQITIVAHAATVALGFIGGFGTYWLKNRAKDKELDRRERQRQTEYEDFKKKRRLIGSGEVERIARYEKKLDIVIKHKKHNITLDEMERHHELINGGKRKKAQHSKIDQPIVIKSTEPMPLTLKAVEKFILSSLPSTLPDESRLATASHAIAVISELGPNQFPVGYDLEGNKVEWLPRDEIDAVEVEQEYYAMMLMRNVDAIHKAELEMFEKVWWNRQQAWKSQGNVKTVAGSEKESEIQHKYGIHELELDDFEYGMLTGKLSALRWVTGAEWDFLDT